MSAIFPSSPYHIGQSLCPHNRGKISATLPDGKEFTDEMEYAHLRRFTDPYDPTFEEMLAWVGRILQPAVTIPIWRRPAG